MKQRTMKSKRLGETIRKARLAKGLRMNQLAAALKVDPSFVSYIEAGDIGKPGHDVLQGLSTKLDLPIEDLYALTNYTAEFGAYLRSKYGLRSDEAKELQQVFERLAVRRKGGRGGSHEQPAA